MTVCGSIATKRSSMSPISEDRSTRQDLRLDVIALEQLPPQMNSRKEVEVAWDQVWDEAKFWKEKGLVNNPDQI